MDNPWRNHRLSPTHVHPSILSPSAQPNLYPGCSSNLLRASHRHQVKSTHRIHPSIPKPTQTQPAASSSTRKVTRLPCRHSHSRLLPSILLLIQNSAMPSPPRTPTIRPSPPAKPPLLLFLPLLPPPPPSSLGASSSPASLAKSTAQPWPAFLTQPKGRVPRPVGMWRSFVPSFTCWTGEGSNGLTFRMTLLPCAFIT